jgi:hypothetical protein
VTAKLKSVEHLKIYNSTSVTFERHCAASKTLNVGSNSQWTVVERKQKATKNVRHKFTNFISMKML